MVSCFRQPLGPLCGIYFAATVDRKYVKIGCSIRPGSRIRALRKEGRWRFGAKDVEYVAIFPVYVRYPGYVEGWLHGLFRKHGAGGEWFRLDEIGHVVEWLKRRRHHVSSSYFFKNSEIW